MIRDHYWLDDDGDFPYVRDPIRMVLPDLYYYQVPTSLFIDFKIINEKFLANDNKDANGILDMKPYYYIFSFVDEHLMAVHFNQKGEIEKFKGAT